MITHRLSTTHQAPDSKVLGPFLSKVPSAVAGPVSLVFLMVVRTCG